jgi:hypothetical protein
MSSLDAEDLIFYSDKENNIYSGGFKINSIIMKNGLSPMVTLNQLGGDHLTNVSDLFQNLVVPNWALSLPIKSTFQKYSLEDEKEEEEEEEDMIDEDLHNKLLALITVESKSNKNKNKTKKGIKISKKINTNSKTKKKQTITL